MDRLDVFKNELALIQDAELRTAAKDLIWSLPEYFFSIPASASGKYHPSYALGEGGLVRHVRGAIKIALELLRMEQYSDLLAYKDEIIIALLLHDGWKRGKDDEGYMLKEHPAIAAEIIRNYNYSYGIDRLDKVASLVESHMGQWNDDGKLPKPVTFSQQFVHLCDYLASRKFLEVNFEVEEQ